MRHRIFLHVVWTTRDREKLLNATLAVDSLNSRGLGHAIAYVLHQAERLPDEAIPGWTPSRLRGVAGASPDSDG